MKRIILPGLLFSILNLSGCGSGRPNTDDPKEFAKWYCQKTHEFLKLSEKPLSSAKEMLALANEMGAAEREFKKKHENDNGKAQAEMDVAFAEYCNDLPAQPDQIEFPRD